MSRIKQAFQVQAKIAYLTAGDGGVEASVAYFMALVKGGVNLLEVGVPYSDPVADGPVIQQAMGRALAVGTNLVTSLEIVHRIRQQSQVAMIMFTYYNLIQADLIGFLRQASAAGADGVLVVDLPYEEAANYRHYCKHLGLAPITVIAPSTRPQRLQQILAGLEHGFVYYACQKGTTGARDSLPGDLNVHLAAIRQVTQLPIAVGFGVASSAMVQQILQLADGCVVGSYLVQQVAQQVSSAQLTNITQELFNVT